MKAHLLYPARDFAWQAALEAAAARKTERAERRPEPRPCDRHTGLPWNAKALVRDLGLDTVFTVMARDDDLIFEVAGTAILTAAQNDVATIRYRQDILQDCLNHPAIVRKLYAIAVEAGQKGEKQHIGSLLMRYPDWLLRRLIEDLEAFLEPIEKLREVAHSHAEDFASEGWRRLFAAIREDLSKERLTRIKRRLMDLRFRNGVLISTDLGPGNKGMKYTLHLPPEKKAGRITQFIRVYLPRLFDRPPPDAHDFSIDPGDESGARALSGLRSRGIAIAANSLAQSADQVRDFFAMMQCELAFYVGCLNLHEQLAENAEPLSLPSPAAAETHRLSFRGLYDIGLALNRKQHVVGNDIDANGKDLVIVTGANQGGKSTFLRSVGLAQLMMQCGMFVPAESFCSSICDALFTHYEREEDVGMESGKFDEELARMNEIVDHITPYSMILFNESFAATNEREGSEIARQVSTALLERHIRMVFVTHLYEFARGIYGSKRSNVLFFRADRQADGTRTFKLIEGEPLQTSFGEDLYRRIFAK